MRPGGAAEPPGPKGVLSQIWLADGEQQGWPNLFYLTPLQGNQILACITSNESTFCLERHMHRTGMAMLAGIHGRGEGTGTRSMVDQLVRPFCFHSKAHAPPQHAEMDA